MSYRAVAALLLSSVTVTTGQMTPEQRSLDFQTLAGQFAKRYGPYEWKRDVIGFDLLQISPFLDRIAAVQNDLDYYEICADYLSRLQDGHVFFNLPSNFVATLGFTVDIYDDRPLIDSIDRSRLPASSFPFAVGDEIIAVDGVPADTLIANFSRYVSSGNPRALRRFAAGLIPTRKQVVMPHATDIRDHATVTIRQASGKTENFDINWLSTGVPLLSEGPVPSPRLSPQSANAAAYLPAYAQPLLEMNMAMAEADCGVNGNGALRPGFALPSGFTYRLGIDPAHDAFYSGIFESGGVRIGFIRIPSFAPSIDYGVAIAQFEREVRYYQRVTDAMIIDVTHNPGGYLFYSVELARRLIPRTFRALGFEMRATAEVVDSFSAAYEIARSSAEPAPMVAALGSFVDTAQTAYQANRGRTPALPLDSIFLNPPPGVPSLDIPPLVDDAGNPIAYSHPIVVMVDDFSVSSAEMFAAMLQDNQAAQLVGMRTGGLGGTNASYNGGGYSETRFGLTRGLMVRKQPISAPGFPATSYIENVGIRPDVEIDPMTRDTLMRSGSPFFDAVTKATVAWANQ